MPKLEYSPATLEKIGAIHRYIATELENPGGAANTVRLIREKIRVLKDLPEIGAPLTARCADVPERLKHARALRCGQYLAVYLYDQTNQTVRVLQIYHTAEDYVKHLL